MFSGALTVRAGPGGVFFIRFPVVLKFAAHLRIVFGLGTLTEYYLFQKRPIPGRRVGVICRMLFFTTN
jgi:hypothetical protein